MKFNKWTLGLAAVGVVSLTSAARADEKMSQLQTALSTTTISGYVDVAATWRPGTDKGPFGGPNIPAYSFAKNDGFSLNAVDIALDKPLDESPWAAGYHVDLMMGADSTPSGATPFSNIRQAYIALRTPIGNGIDWKLGVFDTIIGYEGTTDGINPNYTRSYGYSIEPTTHTGILGTYKVCDIVTVSAGVANSSNIGTFVAPINGTSTYESQKSFLGSVVFTAPDSFGFAKGGTLTLGAIKSTDSSAFGAGSFTSWYAGVVLPTPIAALKLGASFDYLEDMTGGEQWTPAIYATYQFNDKLSFNTRAEYLNSNGGPFSGFYYGNSAGVSDNAAEAVTATVAYNLWANVISRAEFRWDHVEHGNSFGYSQSAFGATKSNDFLMALNVIYTF